MSPSFTASRTTSPGTLADSFTCVTGWIRPGARTVEATLPRFTSAAWTATFEPPPPPRARLATTITTRSRAPTAARRMFRCRAFI
jgi:hypothetical protein